MTQELQNIFHTLVGDLLPIDIVTDVAFPLVGGLDGAAAAFNGDVIADIYSRPHNPTTRILADTINRMDGGVGALVYASGQAAIRNVFQFLTGQNTEIILANHIFGGTTAIHSGLLGRFGVDFKWADATDASSFEAQITDKTRALFFESVANPASDIADFEGIRRVADKYKIPIIVDNTTTPLLFNPKTHGADIIVYSATKYLNGSADATAGIVVDTGRFSWKDDPRYPILSSSVGGLPSLAQRFNEFAFIKGLQSQLTVDGSILAPEKAFTIYGNLATLPERLQAHSENSLRVAEFLNDHNTVERVHFAGLKTDPNYDRSQKYLPYGVTGPLLVTLKGGRAAAAHVINNIGDAFVHAVNIGDAHRNLISHPSTTTHRQLSDAQKEAIGIKPGSLRLSIATNDVSLAIQGLDRVLQRVPA